MSLNSVDQKQIDELFIQLSKTNDTCLGYPLSRDFDYSPLYKFFKYSINNIGDPFENGNIKTNTHTLEREVVSFFSNLLGGNSQDYWGCVTHCGSESNLHSLYAARELYPKAIVYYSDATHYCVKKSIQLLNIDGIMILSQENGEINYTDLKNTLQLHRDRPAIIVSNFGTTMTESKDNILTIKSVLKSLAIQDYYIHCDAALSGAYGNFIKPHIPFDLEDGADSISISGHKFIGSPMPSSVLLMKRSSRDKIAKRIQVIDSLDSTMAGSRNGHTTLFLWYAIRKMGVNGLRKKYKNCLLIADYCLMKMQELGIKAWKIPGAITVVFPKVSNEIKIKYQLATVDELSHIVCMPNLTKKEIDQFIEDLTFQLNEIKLEEPILSSF